MKDNMKKTDWRSVQERAELAERIGLYEELLVRRAEEDGGFCTKDDERREQFITSFKRGDK